MLGTPVLVVVVAVVMVSNSVAIVRWFMCRCKHFSVSTALSDVHVLTGVTCRACAWCVCTEWCARVDGCHVSCLRVLCLHWLMCACWRVSRVVPARVVSALIDVRVLTGVTCRACACCVCTDWCARAVCLQVHTEPVGVPSWDQRLIEGSRSVQQLC